jgi:hypothetical protein
VLEKKQASGEIGGSQAASVSFGSSSSSKDTFAEELSRLMWSGVIIKALGISDKAI